jgi:PemK-like, MazF-like toxin of type II toxin-antitoxin system
MSWRERAGRAVREAARVLRGSAPAPAGAGTRTVPDRTAPDTRPPPPAGAASRAGAGRARVREPGAPRGRQLAYSPDLDGRADPGEVVWTWVPYEEDASRGKDRPVLVVGREGGSLLGLMLSSRDHDGDADWFALGSGAWDGEHRPSWVRLDRVIDVPEDGIRREGSVLDRARFDQVASRLRSHRGWE